MARQRTSDSTGGVAAAYARKKQAQAQKQAQEQAQAQKQAQEREQEQAPSKSPRRPQPTLKQNLPLAARMQSRGRRPPDPLGRRWSGISPTGPTKTSAREDREERHDLHKILLGYLRDKEAQERADARQQAGFEHAERLAAMRGPRVYKFSATMNGAGGVHYRVKYKDVGRPRGRGSGGGASGGSSGGSSSGNPSGSQFERLIASLLGRLDRQHEPSAGKPSGTAAKPAKPAWDYSGWMPVDTEKSRSKAYAAEDFLGAMDKNRSGRYQDGYLNPEYRDRWITFHMGNVRPGDQGYDRRYQEVSARWNIVQAQLDRRFADYGRYVMRGAGRQAAPGQAGAVGTGKEPQVSGAEASAEASVGASKDKVDKSAANSMGAPMNVVSSADRKSEETPSFAEVVIGGSPRKMAAASPRGLRGPVPLKDKAGGHTDIMGNFHEERKSGVLGRKRKGDLP